MGMKNTSGNNNNKNLRSIKSRNNNNYNNNNNNNNNINSINSINNRMGGSTKNVPTSLLRPPGIDNVNNNVGRSESKKGKQL